MSGEPEWSLQGAPVVRYCVGGLAGFSTLSPSCGVDPRLLHTCSMGQQSRPMTSYNTSGASQPKKPKYVEEPQRHAILHNFGEQRGKEARIFICQLINFQKQQSAASAPDYFLFAPKIIFSLSPCRACSHKRTNRQFAQACLNRKAWIVCFHA